MIQKEIQVIAAAYFKLLKCIDWADPVFVSGIREGKNKFLSNAWLSRAKANKYHKTNWISQDALAQIESGDYTDLVFEHLVPKQKYIQDPCERLAMEGRLTLDYVIDLLSKYWHMATITKEEDSKLSRRSLPDDWDGSDIHVRYKNACISNLIPNPYFKKSIGRVAKRVPESD